MTNKGIDYYRGKESFLPRGIVPCLSHRSSQWQNSGKLLAESEDSEISEFI